VTIIAVDSIFGMQEEEEKSSSKASKAAQKRARKKAAAKQAASAAAAAAGAAAVPAACAADISQQDAPQDLPTDGRDHPDQVSTTAALTALQQLNISTPAAVPVSSMASAPRSQQSPESWMVCPLSKVRIHPRNFREDNSTSTCAAASNGLRSAWSMQAVMRDPVLCTDGYTYERAAIAAWFDANGATSPKAGQPLASRELIPNHTLRNMIEAMLQRQAQGS
jgi:U-box domain